MKVKVKVKLMKVKIIKEENSKEFNAELNEFGFENNAHWLYNQYLLVNIRFNATLGELIETFKNLNKSQNVPDLYICDNNKDKRNIIESIANEWFVKYKKHFSSSSNPNIGNTNRNKFIELLDKLYEKHKIRQCNFEKLKKLIENANLNISQNIPEEISSSLRVKCRESGCYLFLLKNNKLEELI